MKKILQLCAVDLSVENLLKPLILSLESEGHIVHIACSDTGKIKDLTEQGLHVIEIPIERKISPWSNLKTISRLITLMKREKYDLVHVHTPVASILGRIAAKIAGVKTIIYTAHGYYFHEGMDFVQYRLFYWIEKIFARFFTDWLLLQSKEDYDLSISRSFKPSSTIIHLGNGVDITAKFSPDRFCSKQIEELKQHLSIEKEEVVVTFIGRFVKEKGIFDLIDSFQLLKEQHNYVKLLMIGGISDSERDLESHTALEGIFGKNPSIINAGYRKDIPELLAISDIFVLPSYREGLPRSIIEAMAMGKPVIASNIRGCREEVQDGVNGFLFEKGNHIDLYNKLNDLVGNEDKRKLFGANSRELAIQEYDENLILKKQCDLINQIK
ncbi:glycosyltransferase family 4 protein [Metabacillus idriensis]|uniref:glycosyltransferase family 4 protein n=1 Tax=Metabacillus idriensis TaxID=324768 RepID=UPI0028138A37|nr:glycosyltransferase family 4 protein [Metabacillus idriensis]MDR0138007.1 glycosyltransferase family 4 protein [Metabacillus idriensis]